MALCATIQPTPPVFFKWRQSSGVSPHQRLAHAWTLRSKGPRLGEGSLIP